MSIIMYLTNSCKKCEECPNTNCSNLYFDVYFRNQKYWVEDATGMDYSDRSVKYLVDSIKYRVITKSDTTDFMKPKVKSGGFYQYNFSYDFSNDPHPSGWYTFIIQFNEQERDTAKVYYSTSSPKIMVSYNDSLISEDQFCNGGSYPFRILK